MADDLVLKLKGQTHRADKVGAEIARLDNQHADVMGRDLFSKRLGCSLQRGLGSTVQRACWQGILGGTTGDMTMVPERWARMAGRTAWRVYRGPKKLVFIWRVASLSLQ